MTGRETGANARPAITRIASSRRMAKFRFTELDSRNLVAIARRRAFHIIDSVRPVLIGISDKPELSPDYLSGRPIAAIGSAIFSRRSALSSMGVNSTGQDQHQLAWSPAGARNSSWIFASMTRKPTLP
jgi:hypothetical protein